MPVAHKNGMNQINNKIANDHVRSSTEPGIRINRNVGSAWTGTDTHGNRAIPNSRHRDNFSVTTDSKNDYTASVPQPTKTNTLAYLTLAVLIGAVIILGNVQG